MYGLASFFTALWMSSAAAHPQFHSVLTNTAGGFKNLADGAKSAATTNLQAGLDPVGKTIAYVGGGLCGPVKQLFGVSYEKYDDNELDMSKLTLVMMTIGKTVAYNLSMAAQEIAKDNVIKPNEPLILYMHGFTDDPTKNSFQTMNSAFDHHSATNGKVTVLALDASSLIKSFYLRASVLVQIIGKLVAGVLAALVKAGYLDPAQIHLIGHSLGAHICGFLGKQFQILTGFKIGRITGLDPAGPCFSQLNATDRLSTNDAHFVDTIHSDAGVYGTNDEIGHVNHYPNEGSAQPGCLLQTCSHSRAWEYFAETVLNPTAFPAVKCNSAYDFRNGNCDYNDTNFMGYGICLHSSGKYFFQSFDKSPYGAGEQGMTYSPNGLVRGITNGIEKIFGHLKGW